VVGQGCLILILQTTSLLNQIPFVSHTVNKMIHFAIRNSQSLKWAVGGWSFFIAENFVLSENRTWIIEKYGDDAYHYVYGTLSTAACASIGYGYNYKIKNAGPFAWAKNSPIPPGAKVLSFAALSLGLGIASQTCPKLQIPLHYVRETPGIREGSITSAGATISNSDSKWKVQCPFDFTDGRSQTGTYELHGLERISRHPGLWSFGLIGLGGGLLSASLPTTLWMSMPLMVALVGGSHTDSRYRRGMGGELPKEVDDVTSNIPFLAMLSGRQGDVTEAIAACGKEVKPINAMLGIGLAAIIVANRGRSNQTASTHIHNVKSALQRA